MVIAYSRKLVQFHFLSPAGLYLQFGGFFLDDFLHIQRRGFFSLIVNYVALDLCTAADEPIRVCVDFTRSLLFK